MDRRRRDLERTFTERPRRWLEDLRVGRLDPWRLELAGYLGLDDARQLLSDLGYRARRSPWTLIQLEDAEPWAQAQTLEDLALTPSDAPDSPHSAPLRAALAAVLLHERTLPDLPTPRLVSHSNFWTLWTIPRPRRVSLVDFALTVDLSLDETVLPQHAGDVVNFTNHGAWQLGGISEFVRQTRRSGWSPPTDVPASGFLLSQTDPIRTVLLLQQGSVTALRQRRCFVSAPRPPQPSGYASMWYRIGWKRRGLDLSLSGPIQRPTPKGLLEVLGLDPTAPGVPIPWPDLPDEVLRGFSPP